MDDEHDLGVGLSYDSIEVEVETDPMESPFDFSSYNTKGNMSPPVSMFYPQLGNYDLHSFVMSTPSKKCSDIESLLPDDDDQVFTIHDELLINEKPEKPKYFIKTMKPKRRPDINPHSLPQNDNPPNDSLNTSTSSKQKKFFFCRSCGKSFKFQTSLLRHNNKVHISKYICPTCNRVFSRQAYLDVHINKLGSSCYLGNIKKSK